MATKSMTTPYDERQHGGLQRASYGVSEVASTPGLEVAEHPGSSPDAKIERIQESHGPRRSILHKRVWISALALVLVVAAAIGGGVGGSIAAKSKVHSTSSTSTLPPSPQRTPSSSTPAPSASSTPSVFWGQDKAYELGCFTDDELRALRGPNISDPAMTPKLCEGLCYNFTYFGVEDSSQCFCGSSLAPGYTMVPNSNCNSTCGGNVSEFCGGAWHLNVYGLMPANPPVESYSEQGCYIDDRNRALRNGNYIDEEMTPELCAGLCSGLMYFGVEDHSQCFCGSELAAGYTKAPGTDCNFTCTGDTSQLCGGYWRLNLYLFQ